MFKIITTLIKLTLTLYVIRNNVVNAQLEIYDFNTSIMILYRMNNSRSSCTRWFAAVCCLHSIIIRLETVSVAGL